MVSLQPRPLLPPALESSLLLLLLVQPRAQLEGSGPSSNRRPRIPRLQWRVPSRIDARGWLSAPGSRQRLGGGLGVRGRGGAGLWGPSAPARDHGQPHPRGRGGGTLSAHDHLSAWAGRRN